MKKVGYFYCKTPLGILERTENGYVYNSNISNEQSLKDEQILTSSEYDLWNSLNRESPELFPDIVKVIEAFSREDILKRAKVTSCDSIWEKLVKIAQLKVFPTGFNLQQSDDEIVQ